MNGNQYYSGIQFQNELAAKFSQTPIRPVGFAFGNETPAMDWIERHHILPPAMYAGKVGAAGGYADSLDADMQNRYEAQQMTSLTGPIVVAAVILAFLYYR